MKKTSKMFGIITLLAVIGFSMAACGGGGDGYDPIVYTSKDASGNTYKLTITKTTGKAAFTPASGDSYTLLITPASGTPKTSRGTVVSYSITTIMLKSVANTTLTVTITSNGTMTKIEGTITIDNGETLAGPGTLTPDGSSGNTGINTASNAFVNTTWKGVGRGEGATLSFGTNTWTVSSIMSGTYTAQGNTAILNSGDFSWTATISGNTLTWYKMLSISSTEEGVFYYDVMFTKVN
jgi:hypothetical protein